MERDEKIMSDQIRHLLGWVLAAGLLLVSARAPLAQQNTTNRSTSSNSGSRSYGSSSSFSSTASKPADGSKMPGTAIIEYDADTGSVIVFTDEDTNKHIQKVIEGLDRPVPQVLIKVLFLEVTHTNDLDLGVEASLTSNNGNNSVSTSFKVIGLPASATDGGFYKIIDSDFQATIHALSAKTKLEVLSRPSILTRNNQQATITVGQEFPFITNSRVTDTGETINTIQYSNIGIILRVTPHIAPDQMVEMEVAPEISALSADTPVKITDTVNASIIDLRSADTRVLVGNGKTVVIGGLMGNQKKDQVEKIPLLGDIPYLGALFSRTVKSKTKQELLIFLTPLVVENPKELTAVSQSERANSRLGPKAFTAEVLNQFLNPPPNEIQVKK